MGTIEEHDGFISGMLALLECGGLLFVNDIGEVAPRVSQGVENQTRAEGSAT